LKHTDLMAQNQVFQPEVNERMSERKMMKSASREVGIV